MTISILFILLIVLICISGFFSSSETGMMAINRYKLRHLARSDHSAAKRVVRLLERPDRLLGVILIGNTFANNLASMLAILLAKEYLGDVGLAITVVSIGLTLVILIFAEVGPKTIAAIYPQKVAFFASLPLKVLLKVLYPVVWFANGIANGILRCIGIRFNRSSSDNLSIEELRTVVNEASGMIPNEHQSMLLSIIDLEKVSVDDVMIPRHEVSAIDLNDEWDDILNQLVTSHYGRLPLFRDNLNKVEGILRVRDALHLAADDNLDIDTLKSLAGANYFIPEGTPLTTQLLNFRKEKARCGFVVDEYGEVQGLVTIEDILEEIVGEFTTDPDQLSADIYPQEDGSFLVDGGIHIRELNRRMGWSLPSDGAKTLSGLIIEELQDLPHVQTILKIGDWVIEVIHVKTNMVRTAKVTVLTNT